MKSKPTILKLGGSAITQKERLRTANQPVIENLAREIADAKVPWLVLVHGGGSFGHPEAEKGKIREGFKHPWQVIEFAKTHDAMTVLNGLIVQALIRHNIPAISIAPSSFVITKNDRIEKMDNSIVTKLLVMGFVPVLYGDAVLDVDKGFTILSGDQLTAKLAIDLDAKMIIMGMNTDGVCERDPREYPSAKTIPRLSLEDLRKLEKSQKWVKKAKLTKIIDVTGGIRGKLIELIPATEHGIPAILVNATKKGIIHKALCNRKVKGTVIEKE